MIPLKLAFADDLSQKIDQIMAERMSPGSGGQAITPMRPGMGVSAPSATSGTHGFKVVADERTNSLIVLAPPLADAANKGTGRQARYSFAADHRAHARLSPQECAGCGDSRCNRCIGRRRWRRREPFAGDRARIAGSRRQGEWRRLRKLRRLRRRRLRRQFGFRGLELRRFQLWRQRLRRQFRLWRRGLWRQRGTRLGELEWILVSFRRHGRRSAARKSRISRARSP